MRYRQVGKARRREILRIADGMGRGDARWTEGQGFVLVDKQGRYRTRGGGWSFDPCEAKVYAKMGSAISAANHAERTYWQQPIGGIGQKAIDEGRLAILPCTLTITITAPRETP